MRSPDADPLPGRDLLDAIKIEAKTMRKCDRVLRAAMEIWREHNLPGIDSIISVSYRHGVITVTVPNSSVLYCMDGAFRESVFKATVAGVHGTVTRIKVKLGDQFGSQMNVMGDFA